MLHAAQIDATTLGLLDVRISRDPCQVVASFRPSGCGIKPGGFNEGRASLGMFWARSRGVSTLTG